MLRHLLFDLDLTLYHPGAGLMQAISRRISRYMVERLGFPEEGVEAVRKAYWREHGTTLAGLLRAGVVDAEDFLRFVHDVPVEEYLQPDAGLAGMLAGLEQAKHIFTNADAHHARRVLSALGVERHFQHLFDIRSLDYVNKPRPGAYRRVLQALGASPQSCLLVDDAVRNLLPAARLGMVTVLVQGARRPGADGGELFLDEPGGEEGVAFQIGHILELPQVLGELGRRRPAARGGG